MAQVFENSAMVWRDKGMLRYNCGYETAFGLINCDSARTYYYKVGFHP